MKGLGDLNKVLLDPNNVLLFLSFGGKLLQLWTYLDDVVLDLLQSDFQARNSFSPLND